jgi:D-3-phosphoglycerate dehydrogenase
MMPPRFVVLSPPLDGSQVVHGSMRHLHGGERIRDLADAVLGPHGEVRHLAWTPGAPLDETVASLDASLAEADALVLAPWMPWASVVDLPVFDSGRLARATDLKVIAGTFDYRLGWIDLEEASRLGVTVVDTSRTMTWTVAEFGLAITLALLRDIHAAIEIVRGGGWLEAPQVVDRYLFRDLADCRIGLAGYGSINRTYRRFIEPFGCGVTSYDPFVGDDIFAEEAVARASSLIELARATDILVVAIPPTPTTLGVIDADVVDALADGSLFVLLSRMAVVEQDALWRRVRAGELRAASDVFDPEPPPSDAWFRRAPNFLATPHMAGNVRFAHERCFTEACADAVRVVSGEAPQHPATVRDKQLYQGTLANTAEMEQT